MLECRKVSVRAGSRTLLHSASASFAPGRLCSILGPNGAGKSTLLSVLSGQREADEGSVTLEGAALRRRNAAELAMVRAVMPQETAVVFDFTVQEVADLGRFPHRRKPSPQEDRIVGEALQATGVAHLRDRIFNTLSGGEKARVHLARSLAQIWEPQPSGRRWLLLDEPTAALDLSHQHQVMRLLRQWAHEQGVGVVAVLHDVNLALRYADDVLLVPQGEPCRFGPTGELLTQPAIEAVWQVRCRSAEGQDGVQQYLFS